MLTARNSDDKRTMHKILANLYAVNSYYAFQDYKRENPKGRTFDKRGNPLPLKSYTLSPLTMEARDIYKKAMRIIWTDETENEIKAYLLRLRMSGDLDKILDWEKDRIHLNPWRDRDATE